MAPFAKTGGLADVAGSLPPALGRLGLNVLVTMPRYRGVTGKPEKIGKGVTVRFVDHEPYFNRSSYYGNDKGDYPDNLERFAYFCTRSLEIAREEGFRPDVVHAHDWQAALLPVFLKEWQDPFFKKTKSVLTIHNLAYQGVFPKSDFAKTRLREELFSTSVFEYYGRVNLLKAGIVFADLVTTVSPTYAKEIMTREYGFGLEGVLRHKDRPVEGILNGLDYCLWDPAKDAKIPRKYGVESPAGKKVCKAELQKRCGLEADPEIPVFGIVSRLAEQKGLDILSEICDRLLSENVQLVLLGDGDPAYRTTFANVGKRHPKRASVHIGFNAAEAHSIYAGSDFFLMPSYFEPCGLGQLISLKYGTLPVVRHTGGLADTILDADEDPKSGNGFVFRDHKPESFYEAIGRARECFADKRRMAALRKRAMKADFSWTKSARAYRNLYVKLSMKEAA